LRYAWLSTNNGILIEERLIAEIDELCPGLPDNLAWSRNRTRESGLALADELDRRAVTEDNTTLRALADSTRLLVLAVPTDGATDEHRRVGKALLLAQRQMASELDSMLAAEIELFCWGWAALPAATDFLNKYERASAAASAVVVGRKMAERRIAAAEEAVEERFEAGRKRDSDAAARPDRIVSTFDADNAAQEGSLVVCRMDKDAIKFGRTREIVGAFQSVINTAMPLRPLPDLQKVRTDLLSEFPYAIGVIDFVLAGLAARSTVVLSPLLLVGAPGGGKTRFARAVGRALGLYIWRTDASRSDGAMFGGTDKRWSTAEPCHPLIAIARAGHANPMVIVDNLERAPTRTDCGRLWDCMLAFTETESSRCYPDPALQTPVDISHVSFIATANSVDPLPAALRDRFRTIAFAKPQATDAVQLLPAILFDLAVERGLDPRWIEPLAADEQAAIVGMWGGGSVRRLRRIVESMVRARESATTKN
jgi:ATP-dependent Lon protease